LFANNWSKQDLSVIPVNVIQNKKLEVVESPSPHWWADIWKLWAQVTIPLPPKISASFSSKESSGQ
jgi:hypothetical protein